MQIEFFRFPDQRVISLDNRDCSEQIEDHICDQLLPHVHREGERLQNEMIAVAIDDHARQSIALPPNNTPQSGIDISPVAIFSRLGNASFEEIKIEILFSPRETPGYDLRFRIVNRAADQMVAPIFE